MGFKLAELFVDVSVKGQANIETSLNKIKKNSESLSKTFSDLGSKIQGVGKKLSLIGGVSLAPFVAGVKIFAKTGDDLQKMSLRTGIAIEELSKLDFVASQSGTSLQDFEIAIKTMQRGLVDADRGLSTAKDNFKDLGISLDEIQGKNPSEQFTILANKLSQIEDPSLRAGLALKLFGRSGSQLLPLLKDGVGGIDRLKAKAESLGLVITKDQSDSAAELTDALDILSRSFKKIFIEIGSALSGDVKNFALEISKIIKIVFKWISNNQKLVKILSVIAVSITALGIVLTGLGIALSAVSFIMGGLPLLISAVNVALAFMAANPIVALITGIALLVLAILSLTGVFDTLDENQKKTQNEMKKTVSELKKQKKGVEELRKEAEKPIEIKTKIKKEGSTKSSIDTTPFFLRQENIQSDPVALTVKFKKIAPEEKQKLQEEISLTPVFSGIEDLFKNAQSAFAENSLSEINKDIVKTNKENSKQIEKNTIALNGFNKRIDAFGSSFGGEVMRPLG